MQLKAILFDLDDTLYSSFQQGAQEGFARCGQYAQEHLGVSDFSVRMQQARLAIAARLPGEPEIHDRALWAQYALESLGINPIPHIEALDRIYWQGVLAHTHLRQGVLELFSDLHAHNIRIGVCTNMLVGVQTRKLLHLGIADQIDFLVTSEEAGKDKPHPAMFALALQKAECQPAQALMVGDSFEHDIRGAHSAGIFGLWLHVHQNAVPVTADFDFLESPDFQHAADQIRARFLK